MTISSLASLALTYDLGEQVTAFSTRRAGGVGKGNYASFSINPYCGDDAIGVEKNKQILCDALHINQANLVLPHQTHHDRVLHVDEAFLHLSLPRRQVALEGIDALITHQTGVCIGVSTADCIPVLLYDPVSQTVAAVHAGWRGTVAGIVVRTLQTMQQDCGVVPHHVRAVIGPGISLQAFEVGDEVYEAFRLAGFPMEQLACKFPTAPGVVPAEKWHLDLWEANRIQLLSCGVLNNNIQCSGICTYKNYTDYFSARRLGVHSGRIFSGILMK